MRVSITQNEENELLLKDLCARLPYGVNVYCEWNYFKGERTNDSGILVEIDLHKNNILFKRSSDEYTYTRIPFNRIDGVVKPYLRTMQSMTEEEDKDWQLYKSRIAESCDELLEEKIAELHDWFNLHHFDYLGLIEKGLAIEAPERMYDTKTKKEGGNE